MFTIGPPLAAFFRDEGTHLSKNLKILSAVAAALALLLAVARMFVADDLESRFPAEAPATLPLDAQVRLETVLSAPGHVGEVDPTVVGEAQPPLLPAHVTPAVELDSADQPARHGLKRVFQVHADLSLVGFEPDDGGPVGKDEPLVQWIDKAPIISFDSQLRTLDLDVDGFPSAGLEIRRRYEHATCTFRQSPVWGLFGESDPLVSGTSHFEGALVLFTWDAGASDYRARVVSGRSDTNLDRLHDLAIDLDLDALRPPAQAGTGYRWTLPASALEGVIRPGGDLQFAYGRGQALEGCSVAFWTFQQHAAAKLEGSLQATVQGRQERDGRQLVAIKLVATVSSHCTDGAFALTVELEFTGDLLWDSLADRAYALEAKATMEMALKPTSDAGDDSRSVPLGASLRFRGEALFLLDTTLVE